MLLDDGNDLPDEPLDIYEVGSFVFLAEGDRRAGSAGAGGATDAMDIGLGDVGSIEVDDV